LWKREMSHMQEFLLDIHGEMVEVLEDHSIRNHRIESLQSRIEKQAAFISQFLELKKAKIFLITFDSINCTTSHEMFATFTFFEIFRP